MLKLETDKGLSYENCVVSKAFDGSVVIRLNDKRLISDIAPEFEGINQMIYTDTERETPYQKTYNGYSVLFSILRTDYEGNVQISVVKPEE